jgi:hypothetical protein
MPSGFWRAIAAYLVPTFPLGYFWHLSWFHPAYERLEMYRADVIIPMGLLSMAVQAAAFAWLYPRIAPPASTPWTRGALRFFLVAGLLAWSFVTLPIAAKYRMTSVVDFMWLESTFTALQFAVVSPLIALAWKGR